MNKMKYTIFAIFLVFTVGLVKTVSGQRCISGWHLFGDKLYQLQKTERNFNFARDACQNLNGDLAIADTYAINDFLLELLCIDEKALIGLNDMKKEGHFTWVDGTPLDPVRSIWDDFEPNDHEDEDCVTLEKERNAWNDVMCSRSLWYFCERVIDLPVLLDNPILQGTTTNSVTISWTGWKDVSDGGEGPVWGYKIYRKLADASDDGWVIAGYMEESQTHDSGSLMLSVSGLEDSTDYEIAVSVIHKCRGMEGRRGPRLAVTTNARDPETTKADCKCDPETTTADCKCDPETTTADCKCDPETTTADYKCDPETNNGRLQMLCAIDHSWCYYWLFLLTFAAVCGFPLVP